jgi:hypothetical protein
MGSLAAACCSTPPRQRPGSGRYSGFGLAALHYRVCLADLLKLTQELRRAGLGAPESAPESPSLLGRRSGLGERRFELRRGVPRPEFAVDDAVGILAGRLRQRYPLTIALRGWPLNRAATVGDSRGRDDNWQDDFFPVWVGAVAQQAEECPRRDLSGGFSVAADSVLVGAGAAAGLAAPGHTDNRITARDRCALCEPKLVVRSLQLAAGRPG